jgi:hypothetical protein
MQVLAGLHDWLLKCPQYDPREMVGEGLETEHAENARARLREARSEILEACGLAEHNALEWRRMKAQIKPPKNTARKEGPR